MDLTIKNGLDIPLSGKPSGPLKSLSRPSKIALNVNAFEELRFKILVKTGDFIKIGQPVLENKAIPGQQFVSPACGTIVEIRRGLKRRLLDIIIAVSEKEDYFEEETLALNHASKEEILAFLMKKGAFPHIRMRPFDLTATPQHLPRDIFIKALETTPYVPPAELQIEGEEDHFQIGLNALHRLTSGNVHLIYQKKTSCKAFIAAEGVKKYAIEGPHPSGNASVHIHLIRPIRHAQDYVWTLSALDVVVIGKLISTGRYHYERVVSIAGNGIIEGRQGYFKARVGFPIADLIAERAKNQLLRLISGDPLCGSKVSPQDFLEFAHTTFCAIPENIHQEPFHFLRLGGDKYSASRTYFSGHVKPPSEGYDFTTNQHGEERPFIDPSIYHQVMPMRIPTAQLVKALLAEDFELAEKLGLFEVSSEDFALPTFICPSKIEMIEIVKNGLLRYSKEMGH